MKASMKCNSYERLPPDILSSLHYLFSYLLKSYSMSHPVFFFLGSPFSASLFHHSPAESFQPIVWQYQWCCTEITAGQKHYTLSVRSLVRRPLTAHGRGWAYRMISPAGPYHPYSKVFLCYHNKKKRKIGKTCSATLIFSGLELCDFLVGIFPASTSVWTVKGAEKPIMTLLLRVLGSGSIGWRFRWQGVKTWVRTKRKEELLYSKIKLINWT